jgi:hypothetical protein
MVKANRSFQGLQNLGLPNLGLRAFFTSPVHLVHENFLGKGIRNIDFGSGKVAFAKAKNSWCEIRTFSC